MVGNDEGFIDLLQRAAKGDPRGVFALYDGKPITFAELNANAASFAAAMTEGGLSPGDRVAVMMRNSLDALAVIFGLGMAGVVWIPLNVQQRGDGLRYILEHAQPALVVADEDLVPTIADSGATVAANRIVVRGRGHQHDTVAGMLATGSSYVRPPPEADAPFAIMYTSGTTGQPKGVVVSHRMMRLAGEGAALASAVKRDDRMLVWEPLYHIGGAQLLTLPMTRGITLAFVERFSASRFWAQAREYRASHIHYLGGILQLLLKQPPSPRDRAHGVRVAWGGGCPVEIWSSFHERFGVEIRECYGMTEASSITTFNDRGVVGSVGTPVPWFSVEILKSDGTRATVGERGEIVVHTSSPGAIFPGYLDNPEATAKALHGGALFTGDIGSFDADRNLIFHGRMTESVRVRGENVSAWEVEHVVAKHPTIENCAMIGVAAEVGEQEIKLFVKLRYGAKLDSDELSSWLGARLAPYQNPRYLVIVDEFEWTPSQRIMKHKLSTRLDDCWDRLASRAA